MRFEPPNHVNYALGRFENHIDYDVLTRISSKLQGFSFQRVEASGPRKTFGSYACDPLKPRKLRSFSARNPSNHAFWRALGRFSAFTSPPAVCSLAGFGGAAPCWIRPPSITHEVECAQAAAVTSEAKCVTNTRVFTRPSVYRR